MKENENINIEYVKNRPFAEQTLEQCWAYFTKNNVKVQMMARYYDAINAVKDTLPRQTLLKHLMVLRNASVQMTSTVEEKIYTVMQEHLAKAIADIVRDDLKDRGINLENNYQNIKNLVARTGGSLPYNIFKEAYDTFDMAVLARTTSVDIMDWARLLLECNVTAQGYDEEIYTSNMKTILRTFYLNRVKMQQTKTK